MFVLGSAQLLIRQIHLTQLHARAGGHYGLSSSET